MFQKQNHCTIWTARKRGRTWSAPVQPSMNMQATRVAKARSSGQRGCFDFVLFLQKACLLDARIEHARPTSFSKYVIVYFSGWSIALVSV